MAVKISSYQKLKNELAQSRKDLIILLDHPDSFEGNILKAQRMAGKDMEKQIWYGSTTFRI